MNFDGSRNVQETRTLPVKDLTPAECRALLVHSHECSSDRHSAYLLQLNDGVTYFTAEEENRVHALIKNGI